MGPCHCFWLIVMHYDSRLNNHSMNRANHNLVYGLVIIIPLLIFSWYQYSNKKVMTLATVATSTQPSAIDEDGQQYAKVSQNCALYYENVGTGTDTFSTELSDFTNLHPLSDFLCGKYSDVMKMTLSDDKTLYLIAPIFSLACGSGGCTYYPLLEEKKGLVRRIRGFTQNDEGGDGSIFGFPSLDPLKHLVSVYWHESAQCGTTNTYTFTATDTPILISSSDSCSP